MILLSLVACGLLAGPPIPQAVVDKVAVELSGIGHPQADFVSSQLVGWQQGSATTTTHDRFVDIDIAYQRKRQGAPDNMIVRLYLESVDPCRVSVDVLSDTGPNPVLLDNALASAVVGDAVCDAFKP